MQREQYRTTELFQFLRDYRKKARGNRRYLILVVDGPLSSPSLTNLFGSHKAKEGLAVFTTYDSGRFVYDLIRYVRYYLLRYAMSFLAPSIKTHDEAKGCFFDKKMYKPDIRLSLLTGGICDSCRTELARYWTHEIKRAIEDMARYVAEDFPHALVMKGGGVKGLAFAGAVLELGNHFTFDTFAGTSAGAIAALLFAAGYSPSELQNELAGLDFASFRDSGFLGGLFNLLTKRGFYPGETLTQWVADRLATKLNSRVDIRMRDLPSRAVVYACSPRIDLLTFDTAGERRDTLAAFAARCSASIPYYFVPPHVDGYRAYDGGLRENFPLDRFLQSNAGKPTLALYLIPPRRRRRWVLADIYDVMTTGDEPSVTRDHADKIISIDPAPIRTTDFDLTDEDKQLLIAAGRAAALRFLFAQHKGPSEGDVSTAEEEAVRIRAQVIATRARNPRSSTACSIGW